MEGRVRALRLSKGVKELREKGDLSPLDFLKGERGLVPARFGPGKLMLLSLLAMVWTFSVETTAGWEESEWGLPPTRFGGKSRFVL